MIEQKRVPWPLWAYAVVVLLGTILVEVGTHGEVVPRVLFPLVMTAWLFFLLKGIRWVWLVTVGISVLGLVPDLLSGSLKWEGVVLSVVGLVLLMLPVTRRYFSSDAAAMSAPR